MFDGYFLGKKSIHTETQEVWLQVKGNIYWIPLITQY